MARHALVIGVPTTPERGRSAEELDAERVTRALGARRFRVEALVGADATRAGIIAGYRRLIARVKEADEAVFYYTGHGGMAYDTRESAADRSLPGRFQFIVPADYADTTDDDFRGISSWELSLLLEQLTGKTDNVTVILDCCYAAQMSRAAAVAGAKPRALPRPSWISIARHYDRVCAELGPIRELAPGGNPKAVRLAACGDWQTASSTHDDDGLPTGILTHAFLTTLGELGELGEVAVSWRAFGAALRARVLRSSSAQRPIVEGPVKRRLFSTVEIDGESIPIERSGEALRLGAGRILGVSEGDIYGVTALGATGYRPDTARGRVRVERVEATYAIARALEGGPGPRELPAHAIAWPLELALDRCPVRIDAPDGRRAELAAAVAGSPRLRVAVAGEIAPGELALRGAELTIAFDGRGLAPGARPWSLATAIRQLEDLVAAQALRELEGEHGIAAAEVEIEWGTIDRGVRIARRAHGAALGLEDRIYLRLRNRSEKPRFVHVFNIGLRGRISAISRLAPMGIRVGPGGEVLVTPTPDPSSGFELTWPELPRDEPDIDTMMSIVTSKPVELGMLETDNGRPRGRTRRPRTTLQRLAGQLHRGGLRSAASTPADPFCVVRHSYVLHPLRAKLAGPGFAVDEDPEAIHAATRPEVWLGGSPGAARSLAIRMRGVAAARPIRLDALVCTRSADPAGIYQVRTLRVAGAAAQGGELLWRGPVRDFVDIYVWVAPARADEPDLTALLADRRLRTGVAEALDALVVRDERAPWSLAGGASAALARAAGDALLDAGIAAAGLLHTSFLAGEDYGIGHHPREGSYHGHGVDLGLAIEDPAAGEAQASSARTRSASQV